MTQTVRLVLLLHNHQPVGNFDGVFEQAYQDSYLPFLDVFEHNANFPIALHTSGPLMEWLQEHHPEYIERLAALVANDRLEIVGGPFYEPILTMIPPADRRGQIISYRHYLQDLLGATVQGMWAPERVWEQSLTTDIVSAGMRFTLLDDFHFKKAGLVEDQLYGYYVTEDNGSVLSVFPGSERLRYTIPFADPQQSIDYLAGIGERHPGAVIVFGDDGEKFGVWPDTKRHVYDERWLARFFEALSANQSWLRVTTPSEVLENVPPLGKLYIPEGSYREMTEWALPPARIEAFEDLHRELESEGKWERVSAFLRGGYWRNFKVKYPETNEMYARMQMVSRRLRETSSSESSSETLDDARRELYRGQCNCAYWHGAFGGTYLPHLRNAVYEHLIAADNLLDENEGRGIGEGQEAWVEARADDFNLDARPEVVLASNRLLALFAPVSGGMMYELDARAICHNLLATLARRHEGYHRKVLAGPGGSGDDVSSIHDRVVFKQEGLQQRVHVDQHVRKSLIDHFYDMDTTLQQVSRNESAERGDFASGAYEAKIRRGQDRAQVQLTRDGNAWGHPFRITKGATLHAGGDKLEIAYLLEGLPPDVPLRFAIELNFAGLPSGIQDRYFRSTSGETLEQLGAQLDLPSATGLHLVDEWLGINVGVAVDRPTNFWTFPIETVSQSEGGFELVHQSVVVMPHWIVEPDANGRWTAQLELTVDTSMAEARISEAKRRERLQPV